MTTLTATRPAGFATRPAPSADLAHAVAQAALRAIALAAIVAIHVAVVLALTGTLSGPATSVAPVPAPQRWSAPAPVSTEFEPVLGAKPAGPQPGAAPAELR